MSNFSSEIKSISLSEKSKLEETGYIIKEKVLNTMEYSDLPQNRERIYIIGFLNKSDANKFNFYISTKEIVLPIGITKRLNLIEKMI